MAKSSLHFKIVGNRFSFLDFKVERPLFSIFYFIKRKITGLDGQSGQLDRIVRAALPSGRTGRIDMDKPGSMNVFSLFKFF